METLSRITSVACLLSIASLLGACAQPERQTANSHPLYVPSTMTVQHADLASGQLAINPYQILPASDAEAFFVPRTEKFVYGQTVFAESTAFSIFTYDQQLISNIWGPSYRYRWVEQSGLTSP